MSKVPGVDFTVRIYATAGMRFLPEARQQAVYDTIQNWFAKHPNWHLAEARTISGSEEGVFGWVAMYKSLGDNIKDLPGFIEIGGASAQVVFPVRDNVDLNHEDIISFKLRGQNISLFSHSFLGFGANEIMKKFVNSSYCFPIGYLLPNGELGFGDANLCQQEVAENINRDNYVTNIVKSRLDNNPVSSWYTVGAVSTIEHKAPLNIVSDEFYLNDFFNRVDSTYCKQSWGLQQQNYSSTDEYLNQNCLISSYFYAITTYGYGVPQEQKFKTFAKGAEADWTLGALELVV